jgi:hypothetical protein
MSSGHALEGSAVHKLAAEIIGMGNLQSAEDLNHFVSVMFLVRIRISILQAPENPIKMLPIQLVVLSVRIRQMQALDPAGMKIMYKMAEFFGQIAQRGGFSELGWLKRCYFARMYDGIQPFSIAIPSAKQMSLLFLEHLLCAKDYTADYLRHFQRICAYETAHVAWKPAAPSWIRA